MTDLTTRVAAALVARGVEARAEAGSVLVEGSDRTWCFSMADEDVFPEAPIADLDPTTMAFIEVEAGDLDDAEAIAAALVKALGTADEPVPDGTRAIPPGITLTRGAVMKKPKR